MGIVHFITNKALKIINIGVRVLSIRVLSQNASINTRGSSGSRYIRSSFGSESRKIDRSHACVVRTIKLLRAKWVMAADTQTVISEREERYF